MHPLSNLNFGSAAGQLQVYYDDGNAAVTGWITSQTGTCKYVVTTDGVTMNTVVLAQDTTTAASVVTSSTPATNGIGTILITPPGGGAQQHISKLLDSTAVTTEGNVYPWSLTASPGDSYYAVPDERLAAPVVANVAVTFAHNTTNAINVANAITGSYNTITVVSQPVHGVSATANSVAHTITYVGNTTYTGTDTFTFKVSNNSAVSNIATVTVTLT